MKTKIVLAVASALAVGAACRAAETSKACALITPTELESVAGSRLELTGETIAKVELCSGSTPALLFVLRIAPRPPDGHEAAAVAAARKMGAQIDVKTSGPITCSTIIPPKDKEMYGFNTTCAVSKGTTVAAIEITMKNRKEMVPIEKLCPLAEKIAKRF